MKNNKKESAQSAQLKAASKAYSNKFKKSNPGPVYAWPMGIWFSVFFIVPLAIIVVYSFLTRDVYGGVQFVVRKMDENGNMVTKPGFTFGPYLQIFSSAYGKIFLRTLWITVISTLITILIAIPCGYAMARSKNQTLWLILIIVPFLTNSLIRIFAWMTILGDNGLLNSTFKFFYDLFHGFNPASPYVPKKFMFSQGAVILVSVYMYLPYAILPVFTAVDRFDFSLLEASRDLGANKPQSMFLILLPGIKSGIISALIFTFIPIFGNYTIPQLVGGKDSYMLGNIIVDQVQKVRNWPLASAFSVIITVVSMAAILWMLTTSKKEASLKKSSGKEDSGVSDGPSLADSLKAQDLAKTFEANATANV